MKIIAINRDTGSAFVKDEKNNKMYRVDINPIPIFIEINENTFSPSKAFLHGYSTLQEPIEVGDKRKDVFEYIAKEWIKTAGEDNRDLKTLKRERLEMILEYANEKGIRNVIMKKVERFINNKKFEMAELYLEVLLRIKDITKKEEIKNNNILYKDIQKLKMKLEEKKKQSINILKKCLLLNPQEKSKNPPIGEETKNELIKYKPQSHIYQMYSMGC